MGKRVFCSRSDALIRLAEFFETSVSALLGGPMEAPETIDLVAQKLEQLNRQLADKNRRSRRVWRAAAGILVFLLSAAHCSCF